MKNVGTKQQRSHGYFLPLRHVKHRTLEAADKKFRVDLGFRGLFGTKHLYPDSVYASAAEETPWEQMERGHNSNEPSFPASDKLHTGTSLRRYLPRGISCLL